MDRANKTVAEMIGELLREAAVVVGVFIPLDMVFTEKPLSKMTLAFGGLVFLLCSVLVWRVQSRFTVQPLWHGHLGRALTRAGRPCHTAAL